MFARISALVFLFNLSLPSYADLVIEITKGVKAALPIAVVPFSNNTGRALPEDIAQIVGDDLLRSGNFEPLPRSRMLSLPSTGEDIYFRDWSILGQRSLLVGTISFDTLTQEYKVQYELYDVQSQLPLTGKVLGGSQSKLRDIAHSIADDIYEILTGDRGVFSTQIAYVTLEKKNNSTLYTLEVADSDGRRSRRMFRSKMPIISPAWSPDGKKLAYVSFESGKPAIFIQDKASGVRTQISNSTGLNSAPAWSPDGNKMAMTLSKDGNAEVYVLNLQSSNLQRLTNHWAIDTEPSWSPNGNNIVFTSDRGGGPQVYLMPAIGGKPQRLTFEGTYNARPRFSLDGKSIYYVHQRSGFNLAALDLESGQNTILTETEMDHRALLQMEV